MKATELMIWDWVKSRTGMNVKIVGINHDSPNNYEPIPLTPEILEKNGWITCEFYSEYTNDDDVQIQWDGSNCKGQSHTWEFSYTNIGFVHELQHVLRLCGLNELADNLKV